MRFTRQGIAVGVVPEGQSPIWDPFRRLDRAYAKARRNRRQGEAGTHLESRRRHFTPAVRAGRNRAAALALEQNRPRLRCGSRAFWPGAPGAPSPWRWPTNSRALPRRSWRAARLISRFSQRSSECRRGAHERPGTLHPGAVLAAVNTAFRAACRGGPSARVDCHCAQRLSGSRPGRRKGHSNRTKKRHDSAADGVRR